MNVQQNIWSAKFGDEYTLRNPQSLEELEKLYNNDYGVSREFMNEEFLGSLDKNLKILEAGANIGLQLAMLQKMGFKDVSGVEINDFAVEHAKKIFPNIKIIKGSVLAMPFADNSFDMVFTSGVLIHIAPENVAQAMKEIARVSKKYVWGFEYYAPELTEVVYRGNKNMLWKTDFPEAYKKIAPSLKLLKEKKYPLKGSANVSQMFLFEKTF